MPTRLPDAASPWNPLTADRVTEILAPGGARWWLSGGAALDRWLGQSIRPRTNIDVSTIPRDLERLLTALPASHSAWIAEADGSGFAPWDASDVEADIHRVEVFDDERGAWVLRVNVEDGSDRAWLYRRDSRLQLPWDAAVRDIDGTPTGAPQVQLVWKALRPRPEDDVDRDAVLPRLSDEPRAWWERALLSIHPHSAWTIPVRSPMFPAKASWNRPQR